MNWKSKFTHEIPRNVDLLDLDSPPQDDLACVIIDLGHSHRREQRDLDDPVGGTFDYRGLTALKNTEIGNMLAEEDQVDREDEYMKYLEPKDDAESAMLVVLVEIQEMLGLSGHRWVDLSLDGRKAALGTHKGFELVSGRTIK